MEFLKNQFEFEGWKHRKGSWIFRQGNHYDDHDDHHDDDHDEHHDNNHDEHNLGD